MTSFFLLEVDGTSKITLEDSSGFLVGEDHVAAIEEYKAASINLNSISGVMILSAGDSQMIRSGGSNV